MAQSDLIRSFLKFKAAIRHFGWAVTLLIVAAALLVRFTQNPDHFGRMLDEGLAAAAALGALYQFAHGLWSVLVVRQQDQVPKPMQTHSPLPHGRFEDPDEAIRRMSGQ